MANVCRSGLLSEFRNKKIIMSFIHEYAMQKLLY